MRRIKEDLRKIADHKGYEEQSNQLIEECAELIQAVSKYRRATTAIGKAKALQNLIEEIVDVEIMLEQVKYLLKISDNVVEPLKIFKIDRTLNRMGDS